VSDVRVTASFPAFEPFLAALHSLRKAGVERFAVYSPVPLHEYEDLLPRRGSPLRWYALAAGVLGCVGGFALCLIASRFYGVVVGGKPLDSWIPYCVVAFELTVLIAGVVTMATVFLHSRLYPRPLSSAYDPGFSVDQFGISVPCEGEQRQTVAGLLREAGAETVKESAG
jgi:molybdopterin-containing oxidoreductase family membrane subunit